jgi:hypothetical protein
MGFLLLLDTPLHLWQAKRESTMGFFIIRHPIASLASKKESTMGVFLLLDTRLHLWQAKKSPQWVFFYY